MDVGNMLHCAVS